jgi:hypothetical protein
MDTILLLDLENTIIGDWNSDTQLLCHAFPILKEWVKVNAFKAKVGIFSWAIWDENDLNIFNKPNGIRQDFETTHRLSIDDELIFTMKQLAQLAREWWKIAPWIIDCDVLDPFQKRHIVEEMWLRLWNKPNTKIILFDDTLPDMTLINNNVENNCLELVNPWTIIKRDCI